jgi:Holliday junction resolvase RusA-like endonuclease
MKPAITYVISGEPVPLARPRIGGPGRFVYDSQKHTKHVIINDLRRQHGDRPLYSGPCHLEAIYYMRIPKTSIKKRDEMVGTYHIFKPDADNLCKFTLDVASMRTINDEFVLLKDDCIIASISVKKIYDLIPRTEFTITELK